DRRHVDQVRGLSSTGRSGVVVSDRDETEARAAVVQRLHHLERASGRTAAEPDRVADHHERVGADRDLYTTRCGDIAEPAADEHDRTTRHDGRAGVGGECTRRAASELLKRATVEYPVVARVLHVRGVVADELSVVGGD